MYNSNSYITLQTKNIPNKNRYGYVFVNESKSTNLVVEEWFSTQRQESVVDSTLKLGHATAMEKEIS